MGDLKQQQFCCMPTDFFWQLDLKEMIYLKKKRKKKADEYGHIIWLRSFFL